MNVYRYRGQLLCEDCGDKVEYRIKREASYDASLPEGTYPDGGGVASSPQHCGRCGLFLENPLTEDGYEYVREKGRESNGGSVYQAWADFYDIQPRQPFNRDRQREVAEVEQLYGQG